MGNEKTPPVPFRLYFFWNKGCPFCKRAEPLVNEFMAKHRAEGLLLKKELDKLDEPLAGFFPSGAPAYLFIIEGKTAGTIGLQSVASLEKKLKTLKDEILSEESIESADSWNDPTEEEE
jgi:thiol-disulfide isomerase/thioredoxin